MEIAECILANCFLFTVKEEMILYEAMGCAISFLKKIYSFKVPNAFFIINIGICEVNLSNNKFNDQSVKDLCSFLKNDDWTKVRLIF